MSKINVLEPNVFNKIAAGEVVERPASIVKELVENSIDAGAKNIDIFVIDGGISYIQVTDDGCGIEASEVKKAFMPHATSKIENADDLESIGTLGFRGEALASIGSVAQVSLTTRTKDENIASYLEVDGGIFSEIKQIGSPIGTEVRVKNIFYNIPVRRKFLKKPKQEENAISEIVARLILANPNIAFTYSADDKVVYQSSGKGKEDALYSVYGSNILKNVIPISVEDDDIEVSGFVSKPTYSKPNSTYQTVIVNGRYVSCKLISTAVMRVYEDYMMTRAYPFFVIYINLPNTDIDVNVHPNKLDIKFLDSQRVFALINHIIDNTLMDFRNSREAAQEELLRQQAENTMFDYNSLNLAMKNNQNTADNIIFKEPTQQAFINQSSEDSKLSEIVIQTANNESFDNKLVYNQKDMSVPEPILQQKTLFDGLSKNFDMMTVKVVGKIFNTFIIIEIEDRVFLIDQHAAHERILYDELMDVVKDRELKIQPLLLPYILETNNLEHQFIIDNLETFVRLGFDIDEFGSDSFKVSGVPYNLPNLEIGVFFNDILKDINTILTLKNEDLVAEYFAQKACKHAVKGGDDLKTSEIINLLEQIARDEPQLQCPHGRPFVVEIKKYDIDKWFKRIV